MEIQVDADGNQRRFLFATSLVPRFLANGDLDPRCRIGDVQESPYYWWFKYLGLFSKLQINAANSLLSNVNVALEPGTEPGPATRLCYPGNMRFSDWWNLHVHLFAEPEVTDTVRIARSAEEIAEFNNPNQATLVFPMDWPVTSIVALAKSVIKQEQQERNVEIRKELPAPNRSQALYRLSPKFKVPALKHSYKVYVIKENLLFHNPPNQRMSNTWFNIGLEAGVPAANKMWPGGEFEKNEQKRKALSDTTASMYKQAEKYKLASLTCQFP
jgi:hypothetical protein